MVLRGMDTAYSIRRQCCLVGVARSSYHYEPVPEFERELGADAAHGCAVSATSGVWIATYDRLIAMAELLGQPQAG